MDHQQYDDRTVNVQSEAQNAAAHVLSQHADLAVPPSAHGFKTNLPGGETSAELKTTSPQHAELTSAILGLNCGPVPPLALRPHHREQPIPAELTGIAFGGNFSPFNGHPPESVRRIHEQQKPADQLERGPIV